MIRPDRSMLTVSTLLVLALAAGFVLGKGDPIQRLNLLEPEPGTSRLAASILGGLAVLLAALILWRIAPS